MLWNVNKLCKLLQDAFLNLYYIIRTTYSTLYVTAQRILVLPTHTYLMISTLCVKDTIDVS